MITPPDWETSRKEPDTEYYDLNSRDKHGFAGDRILDIYNEEGKPFLILRPKPKEGRPTVPPPPHHEGHIVITDISEVGYDAILSFIGKLGPDTTMKDLKKAMCESDLFTAVKSYFNPEHTGYTPGLYVNGKTPTTGHPMNPREMLDRKNGRFS